MKMTYKILIVLGMLLVLIVPACTPAAEPAAETESVATMAALDKILEQGYFTYGLEAQYRPFEFRDEDDNIVGYDVDVADAIGRYLGVEARPVDTSWGAVIQSLYDGQFDFILGGMTATEQRYERVDFSLPYMFAGSGLLIAADGGIGEVADLDGKVVGAGEGTPSVWQLEVTAESMGLQYDGEIRTYDDDAAAYEAMKTGRIDAYASSQVSLMEFSKVESDFAVIPFVSAEWSEEWSCAAFRKEDAAKID